jgi:hypothetical protein
MLTKQTQRVLARRKEMVERWLPQLVAKLGRPAEELLGDGLTCSDFPSAGVRIDFADGSFVQFQYAFSVQHMDQGDLGPRVAVFTEHCGYHEFELYGDEDHIGPAR